MFGAVCARYITALGLILLAKATFAVLRALNALALEVYSMGSPAAAFVAIQVGTFLGIVGALVAALASASSTARTGGLKRDYD